MYACVKRFVYEKSLRLQNLHCAAQRNCQNVAKTQQKPSKHAAQTQQNPSKKTRKNPAKTQQNARFLDVFTHARARQCTVQKIGRGGNEGGEGKEEKEEKEEEEEEEKEEDEEEDEEDEEEDKDGGESVENLVRGDSFKAKAEAKPKQSKIHKTRRQAGGLEPKHSQTVIKHDKAMKPIFILFRPLQVPWCFWAERLG